MQLLKSKEKGMFERFYAMGSFQAQNAYLTGLCQRSTPKVHRLRDGSQGLKSTTVNNCLQLPEKTSMFVKNISNKHHGFRWEDF